MAKTDVPLVEPMDEMHLDDFLNHVESLGNRELAAAFSLFAKAKGWAKKELKSWESEFELFKKMSPEEAYKLTKNS